MIGHDQHTIGRNSFDSVNLGAKVTAVQQCRHGQGVPARLGIESEGVMADFVGVGLDAGNSGVDVLSDHLLGNSDDAVAHGADRLPQRRLPQKPRPPPPGEWHDGPPLLHHGLIVSIEAAPVNRKCRNVRATSPLHAKARTRHDRGVTEFDIDRIGGLAGLRALEQTVLRAGDAAMHRFAQGVVVRKKPDRSPVTEADREVEQTIRQFVWTEHPRAEFFGEETGVHGNNPDLRFVVDPIDGTRAFIRGLPTWSVLVGIEAAGEPVVGIAYMPAAGDFFVAVRGHGATHNGRPIQVSKVAVLADATVTHGCLQQFTESGRAGALARLAEATDSARGFPDFDGYRQVLLGRSDAMVDPGVKPYDICAAAVLIREAGGRLTSMEGEESIYGGSAIASNGAIHDELVAALSRTSYK